MKYTLHYFEAVQADVREAKAWYNQQQLGLGKRFSDSIKDALLLIQKNPLAFAVRYKNIRVAHPKSFPYGVHFYLDDINTQIVIIAVIHSKRHPDVAQKRV